MKILIICLSVFMLGFSTNSFSQQKKQSIEVLFFKAQMCGCKAKACTALENDVKSFLEKEYADKKISFKVITIADEKNKELVEKYQAKSQTVIMVVTKKKKEKFSDLTEIVNSFSKSRNQEVFSKDMKEKIDQTLSQK